MQCLALTTCGILPYSLDNKITHIHAGEFGIVYKGYLTRQYTDEIVAIKTLKGEVKLSNIDLLAGQYPMENPQS